MRNPRHFCLNKNTFKAFVLGADPTNFTNDGKPKELEFVFGILSDEQRYFSGILKNLNQIGLHLENVYIQNTIPEYLKDETSKNKEWETYAKKWLPKLKDEFDEVNPGRRKPVLVTAERIMKFLINEGYKLTKAKEIYLHKAETLFVVKAKDNKLQRPLYAFYRHPSYGLASKGRYRGLLKKKFKT